MHKVLAVGLLSTVVAVAGCEATGPRQATGGLLGAAAGGFAGSQIGGGSGKIAAAVVGALAGAALGSYIGKQMDAKDLAYQRQAAGLALENNQEGQPLPWKNEESGNYGQFTPTRTWQRPDGTYCREFTQTVTVGGRQEQAYGTACRQPDGSWKIVS